MKKILTLLIALLALPLLGISGTGVRLTGASFTGGEPNGGLTVVDQMDFEGTACEDTNNSYTCTIGGAGTDKTGDCDNGFSSVCPLDGTYSGYTGAQDGGSSFLTDTADYNIGSGAVTFEFMINWTSTGFTSNQAVMTLEDGSNIDVLRVQLNNASTDARVYTLQGGVGSSYITGLSIQTTYYFRVIYDYSTGDATLYIYSDSMGGTQVSGSPQTVDDAVDTTDIDQWIFGTSSTGREFAIDRILVCSGSYTGEGWCGVRN